MYIPKSFAESDAATLYQFMRQYNFAALVTQHKGHLVFNSSALSVDTAVWRVEGASGTG